MTVAAMCRTTIDSQDPQLGIWVSNQRQNYRKGLLAKKRLDQLEAIGFECISTRTGSGKPLQHDQWTKMFKRLQAYQQEHEGSCNVPAQYHQDPQLGQWVTTQRCRYKKGLLAKERYDELEAIGFEWTRNPAWTEMFKKLQDYQQEHNGSCTVPQKYRKDPQLGRCVNRQRFDCNKEMLTKE